MGQIAGVQGGVGAQLPLSRVWLFLYSNVWGGKSHSNVRGNLIVHLLVEEYDQVMQGRQNTTPRPWQGDLGGDRMWIQNTS